MMHFVLALVLIQEKSFGRMAEEWLARQQIQPQAAEPAWAKDLDGPRFTFGVISDIHWNERRGWDYVDRACEFMNERKVDFVLVLGDNVSASKDDMKKCHEALKRRLGEKLARPLRIIKGDNDARDFEAVWGESDFAFSFGGVRFVGFGQTRDWEGHGLGWYGNIGWVARNVFTHLKQPTILFTHVPAWPPLSIGAAEIDALETVAPNVAGVLAGHMHYDLEAALDEKPTIMAPALHFGGAPLKIAEVHADRIVFKTYERRGDAYAFADKWQKMDFPKGRKAAADARTGFADEQKHAGGETRFLSEEGAAKLHVLLDRLAGLRPSEILVWLGFGARP